jgi:acetylornithine deacetylase/succinyl-diaminopimelate desuccinylase-like protein
MDDLKEIERTTIDLLQMNGSKKKGLMASMDYVTKRLGSAGMEVTVNQESDVPAIVASKGEGGIVLWGHLDTDSLGGMEHKDQGTVQGGIINGRGAANMKGAVAVMLCVATRLSSWDVPFAMVLTTDALNEQKGAEALSKDPVVQNSKGILILGPTDMTPVIAQVGYAAIQVRTLGDGAVMNMAAFLKKLNDHVKDSSGKLKVKTGSIKGGKKSRPFEMAQSCEVTMELETLDSTDSAITMIDELLEDMEHDTRLLCRSEMVEFDQFSDLAKEVTELSKKEPVSEMVHSEAAMIAPVNQKIVVCGPGTLTNSLSDHEYVTLNELEGTYEAILNLVDRSSPVP